MGRRIWLFKLNARYGLPNSVEGMSAPILSKPILPSLEKHEVEYLIDEANSVRDKAIIVLFTESGLRLSELTNVRIEDIDWSTGTLRVLGKRAGRKQTLHLASYRGAISKNGWPDMKPTAVTSGPTFPISNWGHEGVSVLE